MHNDETGLNILDKTSWLHVASTPQHAYFKVTTGRGFEDIQSVGALEGYTGRFIHDFLPAYLKFDGLERWPGSCWKSKTSWRKVRPKAKPPMKARLQRYAQATVKSSREGINTTQNPNATLANGGGQPRGKALKMPDRLGTYEETLAFLIHGVPFGNNKAERDLRMIKTRQKISGCFPTLEWSNRFAQIRSIIATAKKQGNCIYGILQDMFSNPMDAEKHLFST